MPGERIALLLRESDKRKAEAALASQEHALRLDAAQRGDLVVAVYADAGFSGALLERPAIRDMFNGAALGLFDVVRATELGRLSRGEAEIFYFIRGELARCGVRLEFLDNQFVDDGESDVGALMEGLQVLLPSIERRAIARRFLRGKKRVWDEGFHWSSRPPYGYIYVPGGQKGGGHWEIHPEEAAWVRQMFAWAADGVSMGEIARRLHRQGAPTKHGGTWWPVTVSQILANPKYYGLFASGRYQTIAATRPYSPKVGAPAVGKPGRGRRRLKSSATLRPENQWKGQTLRLELALVDELTWRQANGQRERNKQLSPRNTREPNVLHGLVFCGRDHGNGVERRMKIRYREKGRPCWRCPHRPPGGPYCRGRIMAATLEAAVWTKLAAIQQYPESLVRELIEQWGLDNAVAQRRRRRTAAARAALDVAQLALDNLEVARLRGEIATEQYARLRVRLEQDERAAHKELDSAAAEEIPEEPAIIALALAGTDGRAPRQEGAWDNIIQDVGQRSIRHLVERIIVDEHGASMIALLRSVSGRLEIHDRNDEYLGAPAPTLPSASASPPASAAAATPLRVVLRLFDTGTEPAA